MVNTKKRVKDKKAIVIPIYKTPTELEQKSLEQCLKILGKHPIIFLCSHSFDTTYYEKLVVVYEIEFEKRTFDDKYFLNIQGYNELCLSDEFYKAFLDFEYILIYQLDAWVFRDELDFWCSKGYDYIGAPWYEMSNMSLVSVGNGGFSLRKVEAFFNIIKNMPRIPYRNFETICKHNAQRLEKNPILYVRYTMKALGYKNNLRYILKNKLLNEDLLFSQCAKNGLLSCPDTTEAISFSFELYPANSFRLNGNKLPFGCHGWWKYEYEKFWKNHIE